MNRLEKNSIVREMILTGTVSVVPDNRDFTYMNHVTCNNFNANANQVRLYDSLKGLLWV